MLDVLDIVFPILFLLIVIFVLTCFILRVNLDETSNGDLVIYYNWKGKRRSKIFLKNEL
jgi:hypothetical protein